MHEDIREERRNRRPLRSPFLNFRPLPSLQYARGQPFLDQPNDSWRLTSKGKIPCKAITAVARELVGFIWAVGVQAEREIAAA